jgi:MFS family permease
MPARSDDRGGRVAFGATLALAMGIGPLAIFALSALAPTVVPELELSRTALGSVATVAFGAAAAASVLGGRQVDVFGGRAVLRWVFLTGAAAAAITASARTLVVLWVAAVLAGAGQGVANPVTNKLIAEHVPAGRQGLHIGVKQSGVPMAQALAGLTAPALALVVGWRGAILLAVALAAAGMVLAGTAVPRADASRPPTDEASSTPADPMVWWLTGYAFTVAMLTATVALYVPLYAFERVGLGATVAGLGTGLLGAAGVAARILWGGVAERWDDASRALLTIAVLAGVSLVLLLAAEYVGPWALWVGVVGFGSTAMGANAVVMLAVIRAAGAGRTGRASGVVGLGLYLGFMSGPVTFGALVDLTASYTLAWTFLVLLAAGATAIALGWRRAARRARLRRP